MKLPVALPLLALTMSLAACGGGETTPTPPTPPQPAPAICPQTQSTGTAAVSGAALAPLSTSGPVDADWSAPHVPGRVLVIGAGGSLSAQSAGAVRVLSTVRTQEVVPGLTVATTPSGESDQAFANRLEDTGLKVQPDYLYRKLAAVVNDPGYPGNNGFQGITQDYLPRIRADQAWLFLTSCSKTPVGALTAVLDSGADATHEDLQGRLLPGAAFVGTTAATVDEDGHGTATAGLIGAATNNARGLAGVTWSGPTVLPVKVLNNVGEGSTTTLVKGVNYAVSQNAKVINMSLGLTVAGGSDPALDAALNEAAKTAVLVAAAGNTATEGVYYPASHPKVIAVGAVGSSDGVLACYSGRPSAKYPRDLDIVAPGGAGNCAGGTYAQQLLVLAPMNQGKYSAGAGTSFAAPLVSGVASLMRAANPSLTADQTRALLLATVNTANGLKLLDAYAAVRAATR
ncbi:S8 family peptidase [Deinococcus navajonensis]|uniref:S8 family serine peptidase n=1 Tax=Deinococcus navajonensis TaxID=309884 RepID=A0ABV8XSX7_9DEIO